MNVVILDAFFGTLKDYFILWALFCETHTLEVVSEMDEL